MENKIFQINKEQEGLYLPLELEVDDIEKLEIKYTYPRRQETMYADVIYESENAIVDFSIIGPNDQIFRFVWV